MWDDLIKYILLEKLGYNKSADKILIPKTNYYVISNPFYKDTRPSCQIYKKGGLFKTFNSDVNGKTMLEIWEFCKLLGFYSEYKAYVLQYYNITSDEASLNKKFKEKFHIDFIDNSEQVDFTVNQPEKLKVIPHTVCEEISLSEFEYTKALEYIDELCLSVADGLRPCRLKIYPEDKSFEVCKTAIAFDYEASNYTKYRYLVKTKKNRFRANGIYDAFYKVKNKEYKNTEHCYYVEGEKDCIVVSKYMYDDCYGLSGLSIPKCNPKYHPKCITVLLDHDKFYENCRRIFNSFTEMFPNSEIVLRPKIMIWRLKDGKFDWDKKLDFCDFHQNGKLTKDIIKTGLLPEEIIKSNKIFKNSPYYT